MRVKRLRVRLNRTERNSVTLCVLRGCRRREAAYLLDIPEPNRARGTARKTYSGTICGVVKTTVYLDESNAAAIRRLADATGRSWAEPIRDTISEKVRLARFQ